MYRQLADEVRGSLDSIRQRTGTTAAQP